MEFRRWSGIGKGDGVSTTNTQFSERQRVGAAEHIQKYATELGDWLARFRADCEIIDADRTGTFHKYTERQEFWRCHRSIASEIERLEALRQHLLIQGGDDE